MTSLFGTLGRHSGRLAENIRALLRHRTQLEHSECLPQPKHLEDVPQPLGFFDLPPELRLMIYEFAASEPLILEIKSRRDLKRSKYSLPNSYPTLVSIRQTLDVIDDPPLLRTCRLIEKEAEGIFDKRPVVILCPMSMYPKARNIHKDLQKLRLLRSTPEPPWLQTLRIEYYTDKGVTREPPGPYRTFFNKEYRERQWANLALLEHRIPCTHVEVPEHIVRLCVRVPIKITIRYNDDLASLLVFSLVVLANAWFNLV